MVHLYENYILTPPLEVKIAQNGTFIFKKIKINLLANMPGAR